MKIIILFLIIIHMMIFTGNLFSQTFQWVKQEGVTSSREIARRTILDNSGNMYVIGTFGGLNGGTTVIGNISLTSIGQGDVFIAKYDFNRELVWVRQGGSIYYDYIYGLETDNSGNVFVSGVFSKSIGNLSAPITFGSTVLQPFGKADLYVVKFDINGNIVRAMSYGSAEDDQLNAMSKDTLGNYYITGGYKSTISFDNFTLPNNNGTYQSYFVKLNSDVSIVRASNSSGMTNCIGVDVVTDEKGNSICTGFFSGSASFENITLNSNGENDIMLIKYNSSGELAWAKSYGTSQFDYGLKVDVDKDRNIFLTGSFELSIEFGNGVRTASRGGVDVFVLKSDAAGNALWAADAGSPILNGFTGDESPSDIITDSDGNSYLTGYFQDKIIFEDDTLHCQSGGCDVYFVKYNRNGQVEHKKKIDGLEGGRVFSGTLSKNISDEIFISGSFIGIARFDNITVSSNGTMDDLFVSKLSALTFTGNNTMTLYKDFKLYQNYPNPFNPKTNIEYSLEEDQYVRLKIFDLNGKEVAEPVSLMQKAGNHKIMFDGSSLSSGIYFYTIVSGKQFQTRTMILLK